MKYLILFLALTSLIAAEAKRPNVLLICVDDLRPEVGAYGVDYIKTPAIDKLASEGLLFERHYVQAPTCGASRLALMTGQYGSYSNHAFRHRAQDIAEGKKVSPSLPLWFRDHGYETVSIGKVSHRPGGLSGENWDDPTKPEMPLSWDSELMPSGPWKSPKGAMHGLANGEIRGKWVNDRMKTDDADMDVYQSVEGPDTAYPDGLITNGAIEELNRLATGETPFFLAVGIIRPHLPFGAPAKYMEPYAELEFPEIPHPEKPAGRTTWHGSGEFMKYNNWGKHPNTDAEFALKIRRHYAACVSYADAQIGRVLDQLEALNLSENTIVVLWGDHGYHLGEHAIWGKHSLFEESLHAPLIIRAPQAFPEAKRVEAVAETVDIFPMLAELAGLPAPDFVDGESILSNIENLDTANEVALSYKGDAVTLRTDTHRLIAHKDGFVELYEHTSPAKETVNIAESEGKLVDSLIERLRAKAPDFVAGYLSD